MRTGRPPLSDATKRQRGTLDPRWTEQARAGRAESKVVALFGEDSLKVIPDPPAGLHPSAAAEYGRWCRVLHESGKLTALWVKKITLYAIAEHNCLSRLAEGKLPRGQDMTAQKSFLSELGAINADTPATAGEGERRKFARFGFASRVRPPQAG
jgi:hypothetical protein